MNKISLSLVLLSCLVCGCDNANNLPAPSVETNTPEGKFDWVMQKLKRAILDTSADRSSGLSISDRSIESELIPPSEGVDHYRARITVSYEAEYVPNEIPVAVDREKEAEKRREEMRKMQEYSGLSQDEDEPFDPLSERMSSEMEDLAVSSRPPKRSPELLEVPSTKESKVYELAYQNDHWKLLTELETESEKLWFDYALGKDLRN